MSERGCLWRAAAPDALAWREWDDELVVYNETTGNTHHLSAFGGLVLLLLVANPSGVDVATIVRDIESRAHLESNVTLEADAENALVELAALQLAERVTA